MIEYVTLGVAAFAVVLALGAIALAFLAARRSADTSGELRRHREAHAGLTDAPARRHGERRPRPSPRPDPDEDLAEPPPPPPPPPSGRRRAPDTDDLPATQEHAPPTTAIRQVPRPGQLR